MPIDPNQVQWDEPAAGIDPSAVQWDAPAKPRKELSAAERFMYGIRQPLDAGTQMATKANAWLADRGVVPRLQNDDAAGIEQRRAAYEEGRPEGMDWANLAGNVVSPANLALMALPGGTLPRAMAIGATSGLLSSPVEDGPDFLDKKLAQAQTGAAGGAVFNVGGRALSRVISPRASVNPDLQLLRREGVRPTIGQAMGGNISRAEQKLASVPFVGDAMASARYSAREDFNRAAYNRALAPIGQRTEAVGQDAVTDVGGRLGNVYDEARVFLGNPRLDRPGVRELRSIVARARTELPQREQDALRNVLNRITADMTPTGRIRDFKNMDSFLGTEARRFGGSTDAYQQRLGEFITDSQNAITGSMMRRNPGAQVLNENADAGYAQFVRLRDAAARASGANNAEGVFTPGQLLQSIRKLDRSAGKGATARGDALLQDLAGPGQRVLGNTVPNSGTADRLMMAGALGGAAYLEPTTLAALAAGRLAYTPQVQRLLVAAASSRPEVAAPAAQALRALVSHSAPVGATAAGGLMDDNYTDY